MRVTDDQLSRWTKPAFGNEEELAANTEAAVRRAVSQHPILSQLNIRILPKGSIKNNTNVRRDSDIDVAVVLQSHIALEYTEGATMQDTGLMPYSGISLPDFKAAVGQAMANEFGVANVDGSGNKVFRIRGSHRVMNADVIPSSRYWYVGKGWHHEGIALILDNPDGRVHFNYPDQHHSNGVAKNNRTGRSYKRGVRILKNIENHLVANSLLQQEFPSFLVESMAYNVPDTIYNSTATWRDQVKAMCEHMWGYVNTSAEPADGLRWVEVNGHKFLFGPHQKWSKAEAANFVRTVYGVVV